jgi:fluoroquinolone transport system permease protein
VSQLAAAVRCDVRVQARAGFYWATAFIVLVMGALLLVLPDAALADEAAWIPAVLLINLQITTLFFTTGLVLLERDEGTLAALAVSPLQPSTYLAARPITLTVLGLVETLAILGIGFGSESIRLLALVGAAGMGVLYTACGAALASRFDSVNALILPATVFATVLLLPLLPHFGLAPRALFLIHPLEPSLALVRAAYGVGGPWEVTYEAPTCGTSTVEARSPSTDPASSWAIRSCTWETGPTPPPIYARSNGP